MRQIHLFEGGSQGTCLIMDKADGRGVHPWISRSVRHQTTNGLMLRTQVNAAPQGKRRGDWLDTALRGPQSPEGHARPKSETS